MNNKNAPGQPGQTGQLLRGIGFAGAALIILNSMIGAGIFALPAAVADHAGTLSPWLFLAGGLLITTVVLTYSELASYCRESGGPVLYTTTAFGSLAGFTAGWFLYLSRMAAFAANATVMAIYLGSLWPWFTEGAGRALVIVGVTAALTWANYVGVRDGVRTIGVFTVFKILPLLLLILIGLPHVTNDVLFAENLPKIEDPGATMLLLIYAFVGFEAGTITAGETNRPRHTIPRALVGTVVATGIFYFLIVLVYVSVVPATGKEQATLVDIGYVLAGAVGALVITVAAVFSIGGNLASIMLTVPRLTFALSQKQMLPDWFGRVHDRYNTPGNSILFLGALSMAFALTGTFAKLAVASSLMRLIVYLLCIAALPVIRRSADDEARAKSYRLWGGYSIPFIAFALCLWIAAQSDWAALRLTGALFAAGLVLYAVARIRDRQG
jgi:amino acid transporter